MQQHTVQQLTGGPAEGLWVYTGGNRRMGRYVQCCAEAWLEVLQTPADQRDHCLAWALIGHPTREGAYAHMRALLLDGLQLDARFGEWAGCRAPTPTGRCDRPTKEGASIPPMMFSAPLCHHHKTREVVEAMWSGPGDWAGSF